MLCFYICTYIWRGERGKHKDCRKQKKAEVPSLLELSCIHQDQGAIDAIRALSNAQDRSTDKYLLRAEVQKSIQAQALLQKCWLSTAVSSWSSSYTVLGSSATAKWSLSRDLHASSQINSGQFCCRQDIYSRSGLMHLKSESGPK